MRMTFVIGLLTGAALFAPSAYAHHSAAAYDLEKKVELIGVVKSASWRNPHSQLVLAVSGADGKTVEWEVDSSASTTMMRRGWQLDRIKVGEKIKAGGFVYKNGEPHLYMVEVTLSDGTRFGRPDGEEAKRID